MGKKYLDTKQNTVEASVLDIWAKSSEEQEAIRNAARMFVDDTIDEQPAHARRQAHLKKLEKERKERLERERLAKKKAEDDELDAGLKSDPVSQTAAKISQIGSKKKTGHADASKAEKERVAALNKAMSPGAMGGKVKSGGKYGDRPDTTLAGRHAADKARSDAAGRSVSPLASVGYPTGIGSLKIPSLQARQGKIVKPVIPPVVAEPSVGAVAKQKDDTPKPKLVKRAGIVTGPELSDKDARALAKTMKPSMPSASKDYPKIGVEEPPRPKPRYRSASSPTVDIGPLKPPKQAAIKLDPMRYQGPGPGELGVAMGKQPKKAEPPKAKPWKDPDKKKKKKDYGPAYVDPAYGKDFAGTQAQMSNSYQHELEVQEAIRNADEMVVQEKKERKK